MTMLTRRAALAGLALFPAAAAIAAPAAGPQPDAELLDLARRYAAAADAEMGAAEAAMAAFDRARDRQPPVPPEIRLSRFQDGARDAAAMTGEMVDAMFALPAVARAVGPKVASRERKKLQRMIRQHEASRAAIFAEERVDELRDARDAAGDRRYALAQEIIAARPATLAGVLVQLWLALELALLDMADGGRRDVADGLAMGACFVGLPHELVAAEGARTAFEHMRALSPAPLPPFAAERRGETA